MFLFAIAPVGDLGFAVTRSVKLPDYLRIAFAERRREVGAAEWLAHLRSCLTPCLKMQLRRVYQCAIHVPNHGGGFHFTHARCLCLLVRKVVRVQRLIDRIPKLIHTEWLAEYAGSP